jgi:hypothetical protein
MILNPFNRWTMSSILVLAFLCNSCGIYSFTGTSISPDIKTISISNFENNSGEGPSTLTQRLTEDFRDYFQRNTNLTIVPSEGDLQLTGQILGYSFSPAAIQRQGELDIASVNRLTITVQVAFENNKDPEQNFEQSFNAAEDFPQEQDPSRISDAALSRITERIIVNVFNKSVANW